MINKIATAVRKRLGLASMMNPTPPHWPMQWWQTGRDLIEARPDPMTCSAVRGAIDLVTTSLASMPLQHKRTLEDGSTITVQGGIQRMLDEPIRGVLTGLDFVDFIATNLLEHGNAFAFIVRDDVGRAVEAHPLPYHAVKPIIADDGSVYYSISESFFVNPDGIGAAEPGVVLRAADILHVRLGAHRHPLVGVSPLDACGLSVGLSHVIQRQEVAFYTNSARPSGALVFPDAMSSEQMHRMKEVLKSVTTGAAQGSPMILSNDAKFVSFGISAHDAETINLLRMTVVDIARAFRIPPPLLGDLSEASFSNVAELNRHFITGLRFYTRAISLALGNVLRLPPGDYIAFDEEAALQPPSERERIQGLGDAVRGGVMTPNEARRRMGLPPVEGGDHVYLQRQNQPISQLAESPVFAGEAPPPSVTPL